MGFQREEKQADQGRQEGASFHPIERRWGNMFRTKYGLVKRGQRWGLFVRLLRGLLCLFRPPRCLGTGFAALSLRHVVQKEYATQSKVEQCTHCNKILSNV